MTSTIFCFEHVCCSWDMSQSYFMSLSYQGELYPLLINYYFLVNDNIFYISFPLSEYLLGRLIIFPNFLYTNPFLTYCYTLGILEFWNVAFIGDMLQVYYTCDEWCSWWEWWGYCAWRFSMWQYGENTWEPVYRESVCEVCLNVPWPHIIRWWYDWLWMEFYIKYRTVNIPHFFWRSFKYSWMKNRTQRFWVGNLMPYSGLSRLAPYHIVYGDFLFYQLPFTILNHNKVGVYDVFIVML
jgi:hypothetical protein